MADVNNSSKPRGLTRGKAILIAVLAVVLVVILYIQFGPSGATASTTPTEPHRPRQTVAMHPAESTTAKSTTTANTKTPTGKELVATAVIDGSRWKPPVLATVTAYDPFALPAKFPQPARSAANGKEAGNEGLIAKAAADDAKKLAETVVKLQMQLKELEERGVHVIVREHDQYAAVIGDRMLHVGDEINGFTVTAIDPGGVSIERKKSP